MHLGLLEYLKGFVVIHGTQTNTVLTVMLIWAALYNVLLQLEIFEVKCDIVWFSKIQSHLLVNFLYSLPYMVQLW